MKKQYWLSFQSIEFLIFATLMFLDTLIFMIMSIFYEYRPTILQYEKLGMTEIDLNADALSLVSPGSSERIPLQLKSGDLLAGQIGLKRDRNKNP